MRLFWLLSRVRCVGPVSGTTRINDTTATNQAAVQSRMTLPLSPESIVAKARS